LAPPHALCHRFRSKFMKGALEPKCSSFKKTVIKFLLSDSMAACICTNKQMAELWKDGFDCVYLQCFCVVHINKILSCADADRLHTGYGGGGGGGGAAPGHGGKKQGVHGGGLVLYKFEFPRHQKIHVFIKWGFTKFNMVKFEKVVVPHQRLLKKLNGPCIRRKAILLFFFWLKVKKQKIELSGHFLEWRSPW
uniref:Uncharacterized protein n=1 Tax=Apteryx owenii TaxID=8824 RepID=A0A8B9QIW9_APTOW